MTLRKQGRRDGLTLLELIVVLVVLVGLAGILVPMLPNMLTRTHTSTAATTMGEIAKAIGTYEMMYWAYPDGWDTLLNQGGQIASFVSYSTAPGAPPASGGTSQVPIFVTPYTLQPGDLAALNGGGISTFFNFNDATPPASVTFFPYGPMVVSPIPTATQAPTVLAAPTPQAMANLGLPMTGQYVIFGLGMYNQMVGRTIADAPVHFSDDPNQIAPNIYARYIVIFKVGDWIGGTPALWNGDPASIGTAATGGTYTPLPNRALLAGCCDISYDSGLEGIGGHLSEFYVNAVNASK